METLVRRARETGYMRICFAVKQKEALARFYRKFNAKPFGEMPDEELGKIILYYIPL